MKGAAAYVQKIAVCRALHKILTRNDVSRRSDHWMQENLLGVSTGAIRVLRKDTNGQHENLKTIAQRKCQKIE